MKLNILFFAIPWFFNQSFMYILHSFSAKLLDNIISIEWAYLTTT